MSMLIVQNPINSHMVFMKTQGLITYNSLFGRLLLQYKVIKKDISIFSLFKIDDKPYPTSIISDAQGIIRM